MSIQILLDICQTGMFLIQWIIISTTSVNLLQSPIKKRGLVFGGVVFSGMGLAGISRIILNITKSIPLNTVLCAAVIFIVNFVWFSDSLKRRMGISVVELAMSWLGEGITAYLLLSTAKTRGIDMIYGYDSMYAHPEYVVLSAIYSTLLFFVLFMTAFALWKGMIDHFWMKEYLLYIIVPFYQLILIMVYYSTCRELEQIELTTGVLLVLFSLIIDFSMLHLVNGMVKKMQMEKELMALYMQRQTEMKYYEIAVKNMEEIREIRSDFGGQLQKLYRLLKKNEYKQEVREILDVSAENLRITSIKRYCENAIVNAVLVIKKRLAEEKNIVMECECNVAEEVGIEMIDLCSLFVNLIDNAIEASEKIGENGKKWVSVRAGVRGGYLTVKIQNTYFHSIIKEKGRILTNKQDKENHGYGLRLIEDIIKKYDGNLDIDMQEDIFKVVASLKVTD